MPVSRFRILNVRILSAFTAIFFGSCCWTCVSGAQTDTNDKTPKAPPSFRLESNLVIVRVVVRDAGGYPITGLKREDFRLFDQGKEQAISQFEEEPFPLPITGNTDASKLSSAPSSGAPHPRFIAFYFDDLNSSAADLMQACDAADRYLASSLQPNDRVALFSAEKVLSDFTSDAGKIHQALMQLRAGSLGPASQHLCPALSDYQALHLLDDDDPQSDAWKAAWEESKACPVAAFASTSTPGAEGPDRSFIVAVRVLAQTIVNQSQDRARRGLKQFEKVVDFTAPAPGDRSIVLVSPGFLSQNEQPSLNRIIDHALRAGVVINSLDPKGLAVLMREADASRNTASVADPRAMQVRSTLDRSGQLSSADALVELAQGTGGQYFHNDNDLRAGFEELAGDPPHYILAFSPKNVRLDGKFHTLKVSLAEKRKGYEIQARRGYFAVPNDGHTSEPAADLEKTTDAASKQPQTQRESVAGSDTIPSSERTAAGTVSAPRLAGSIVGDSIVTGGIAAIPPASAAPLHLRVGFNRITVDQLRQLVTASGGKSDADVAKQLASMEVTERVDLPNLTHLEAALPGNRARQALLLLADSSAFLKQPASPTPLPPTPTVDEQVRCLKAAANYVVNTLGKLPNFYATRNATVFADSPAHVDRTTMFPYEPLHPIDQSKATVLFRDGKESLDSGEAQSSKPEAVAMGLVTTGEFGPLLGLVMADASRSSLSWSHWEATAAGLMTVYRYAVPRDKSHYQVEFCCALGSSGMGRFRQVSGYHGEIFVDPANGAVLRITLQADLQSSYPMVRADMMVEYGPVEIGGKTYICPIRSVSIAKAYIGSPPKGLEGSVFNLTSDNRNEWAQQTMINDVEFGQYHVFRSDSRILPATDQSPQ